MSGFPLRTEERMRNLAGFSPTRLAVTLAARLAGGGVAETARLAERRRAAPDRMAHFSGRGQAGRRQERR